MQLITIASLLLLILHLSSTCLGYQILVVYPSTAFSHHQVQQSVTRELLRRGHHVTVITPFLFERDHPNITLVDVSFLFNEFDLEAFTKASNIFTFMRLLTREYPKAFDKMFASDAVQQVIRNENNIKYDAVIVENLGFAAIHAFGPHFNTTLIGLSSLSMPIFAYNELGDTNHPVLHPMDFVQVPSDANLIQRWVALYKDIAVRYWAYFSYLPANDFLMDKYFPHLKTNGVKLMGALDFGIENVAVELGYSQPIVPNTKKIGFLHVRPPQPLPSDLQAFLDAATNGVIYVSFGSNVQSSKLGSARIQMMLETFAVLKYHVLWKFEDERLIRDKPKNVMIVKWVPQQDVLAHKHVKLFVTQGGAQSREEAIERGVPMLVIPFYGDQTPNGAKVEQLGIGKMLPQVDFNREAFETTINSIVQQSNYKEKVMKLRALVKDAIMPPVEQAAWWIEYAIRNRGAAHLKYKGAQMSFVQYYFLDIFAAHLVLIYLTAKLIKRGIATLCCSRSTGTPSTSSPKKKKKD